MTLSAARKEVATRTDKAIERETALKWAYRAVACWERAAKARDPLPWILRAADYKHESLEHAATVGDHGRTLSKVEKILDRADPDRHSGARRSKTAPKRKGKR